MESSETFLNIGMLYGILGFAIPFIFLFIYQKHLNRRLLFLFIAFIVSLLSYIPFEFVRKESIIGISKIINYNISSLNNNDLIASKMLTYMEAVSYIAWISNLIFIWFLIKYISKRYFKNKI